MGIINKFLNYLNLPHKIRMMVIDKMEPEDRCRFIGCSKLCNEEAKTSKNYMYGLEFQLFKDLAYIIVEHVPQSKLYEFRKGSILTFEKSLDKKYLKCENLEGGELWLIELGKSINIAKFATGHFKILLQKYQNIIKDLAIDVPHPNSIDFEIENLNNLERLTIYDGADIRQFLSKTRKTLKYLYVKDERNGRLLENSEHIFQVQQCLHSSYTQLSNQQFLQLSASVIMIHIGELTEVDIFNFIRSWQNDTIRDNMERCSWNLEGSKFNVRIMFELFGENHNGLTSKQIEIRHNKEAGKIATLKFFDNLSMILFVIMD